MAISASQARAILERVVGVSAVVGMASSAGACSGAKQEPQTAVEQRPTVETACNDGKDDDGDGKVDCADEDCSTADPLCAGGLYAAPF